MIKKLIKFTATKVYDISVSLAAFIGTKILKNLDKISVLGIIIMILQQFTKSPIFRVIIIMLKIFYAVISTYAVILTFTPYYSHIEILDFSLNYVTESVTYYKNNLMEAYDVLMYGKNLKLI